MSTLEAPSKVTSSNRQEVRQDSVVTWYMRAWGFFDKYRKQVYGALAVLVLLVLGLVGYAVYHAQQSEEAQQLLADAVTLYDQGSYQQALNGTSGTPGLIEIAQEYGGTEAGNMARFYAADALYQLGQYDRALEYFQAFEEEENLLGASSLAGEAAIYENREEYEQAGDRYLEAASLYPSEATSPQYLLSAGRAYEAAGAFEAARSAYEQIQSEYPDTAEAQQVEMYLARLEAKAQSASS